MKRKALFPGSFDPFHKGHEDIVNRALELFDEIVVAVGVNANKSYMYSLEKRIKLIEKTFEHTDKVTVTNYVGLTIDFCNSIDAQFILRGIRNPADFEFEKAIAQTNRTLNQKIETVFLITSPEFSHISSSIVRDVYRNGGDISPFVSSSTIL
jgi:pantetheine-phosphate adenylyltransferase